jgi:hypothetical protein
MSSLAAQEKSTDLQARGVARLAAAAFGRACGKHEDALVAAEEAFACLEGLAYQYVPMSIAAAGDAALALGSLERVEDILRQTAAFKPAQRTQSLQAHEARIVARLAAAHGDERADSHFRRAVARFREIGMRFWLAVTLLEHGEWLAGHGRAEEAESLLGEARETFERLRAAPWLERLDGVRAESEVPA